MLRLVHRSYRGGGCRAGWCSSGSSSRSRSSGSNGGRRGDWPRGWGSINPPPRCYSRCSRSGKNGEEAVAGAQDVPALLEGAAAGEIGC
jgi:hypothetical protein